MKNSDPPPPPRHYLPSSCQFLWDGLLWCRLWNIWMEMVEYTILSNCLHTQFHKRIEHKHACYRSYCRENFPTIFCAVVSLTLKPYIVDQHPLRSQIESCFQALELIALRRCCKKTIPGLSFSAIRKTFPTCPEMWIELNVKLFIFKIQAFSFIFFGERWALQTYSQQKPTQHTDHFMRNTKGG